MTVRLPTTVFFALFLAGTTLAPIAQAQERGEAVKNPDAEVYVDGLACPFCAYGLEKKLKDLDAIRKMEVQLEKGRVLLAFKEEKTLTKDEIQQAVKKAGFPSQLKTDS